MASVPQEVSDGFLRDWAWAGFPGGIARDMNPFGAVLCLDIGGNAWILSPADLEAYIVSDLPNQVEALWGDPVFQDNWHRAPEVVELERQLGPLGDGEIYGLQIPEGLQEPGERDAYRREPAVGYMRRMADLARRLHEAGPGCDVQIDSGDGHAPRFTIVAPGGA